MKWFIYRRIDCLFGLITIVFRDQKTFIFYVMLLGGIRDLRTVSKTFPTNLLLIHILEETNIFLLLFKFYAQR